MRTLAQNTSAPRLEHQIICPKGERIALKLDMRLLKLLIPAGILISSLILTTSLSVAKPEYTKKEKKSCTYCHAKQSADKAEMAKNLNDVGTCYKDNEHSLAKCAPKK